MASVRDFIRSQMILRKQELDRVEGAMKGIRESYDSHQSWNKEDRDEFRRLKMRREELKQILGLAV
jgi:hypothetical protein